MRTTLPFTFHQWIWTYDLRGITDNSSHHFKLHTEPHPQNSLFTLTL